MSSSDLVALAILPAAICAQQLFVALSPSQTASQLRTALTAKTKQQANEGARLWAVYGLTTYLIVIVVLLLWLTHEKLTVVELVLKPSRFPHEVLKGAIFGLTLIGTLLIFRRFFPEAKKFGFMILAGIASPVWIRISALLVVAFTEEFWRIVCLTILVVDGLTGPQALVITSVAYGVTYLSWGYPLAISDGILGAAYGALFLWSGSFYVPFVAHSVLRGQHLLYAIAASPDAEPGDLHRRPHAECPACGVTLSMRQVNLNFNEAFSCPACHARITVSDRRRAFFRWGLVLIFFPLLLAVIDIFPGAVRNRTDEYWLALIVLVLAGWGLSSFLFIIFPPKLECGDPDFVRLNLSESGTPSSRDTAKNEINQNDSS